LLQSEDPDICAASNRDTHQIHVLGVVAFIQYLFAMNYALLGFAIAGHIAP